MKAALLVLAVAGACNPARRPDDLQSDSATVADREQRFDAAVAGSNGPADQEEKDKPVARWVLPRSLAEVSGLALTPDGRLLAHDDESARITEIDYRRGIIVKSFTVGRPPIRGDFEGITVGDGTVFLLASNGIVYGFPEGRDTEQVDFRVYDTRLGPECEFEGIAYESSSGSLVLACKVVARKQLARAVVLYRWKLEADDGKDRATRIAIPWDRVSGLAPKRGLHPSDLAIDPATGQYVLVTARESALVEIAPGGTGARARPLPGRHQHAEGLAITKNRLLIVSDEAGQRAAAITLYRWP